MASPVKRIPKERKFWLVVNTELIVYGQQNRRQSDGSGQGTNYVLTGLLVCACASRRKQVIPVEATSSDQEEVRTITLLLPKRQVKEIISHHLFEKSSISF